MISTPSFSRPHATLFSDLRNGAHPLPQAGRYKRGAYIKASVDEACHDSYGGSHVEAPVLSRRAAILSTGGAVAASLCSPPSQASQLQAAGTGAHYRAKRLTVRVAPSDLNPQT